MKELLESYFIIYLPIIAIIFTLVSWLIGLISGWHSLSEIYPFQTPQANHKKWKHCSVPNLTMRNCVHVTLDSAGIYFEMAFPFNFGNHPIFIPWQDITIQTSHYILFRTAKLSFKKAPNITFQFYNWTANKFAKHADELWESRRL